MAAKDSKLELLHSVPIFARLRGRDLEHLGQISEEVDLPAGRVLMRQGDLGSEMFVLASGAVVVERDGREIARHGAGAILGEIALVSEGPRTATVTLTEPSTLFVLGHREFHTLMEDSPEIKKCVLDDMAERLRALETDRAH